jgi:hypothetical protein
VLSHRDGEGLADLSGTATLLELARVLKTSELRKTLVLVSTSGATTGFAGARAWAKEEVGGPVDGVIVLGDMAGTQITKPWVVSWPAAPGPVPLGLERTVQAAVRRETRSEPGGPRALGQWVRRALPVTLSEQGPIGAEGLPAVLISESGERGPSADEPVMDTRLQIFGSAALSAIGGVDAAGAPIRQLERFVIDAGVVPAGELPATAGVIDITTTRLPDGRILIAGGRPTPGGPAVDTAAIARLDFVDGTVDVVPTVDRLAVPRAGHHAVPLCDGTVWIGGGAAAAGAPAAERYNPPPLGRR